MVGRSVARVLELSVPLREGLTLAAQAWSRGSPGSPFRGRPVLALHGWLDNSNSFLEVAPALAEQGFLVVAIDWPGHGRSEHRSFDASYLASDLPWYAGEVVRELQWSRFGVLGHSMGAAAGTLMAGSQYPSSDALVALCCLDLLGPLSRSVGSSGQNLLKGLKSREKYLQRQLRGTQKVYGSLEDCIAARLRSIKAWPGQQRLTDLSARRLVQRGAEAANENGDGWRFRHDVRLNSPSPSYYTEEQVLALLQRIETPCLLIEAEGPYAWPRDPKWWTARKAAVRGLQSRPLFGGHHLHLDEDTAPKCAEEITAFFEAQVSDWDEVELKL